MKQMEFRGSCPECGSPLGLRLEPQDNVVNGFLPNANRVLNMFDIEAHCQECDKMVEPRGLHASP